MVDSIASNIYQTIDLKLLKINTMKLNMIRYRQLIAQQRKFENEGLNFWEENKQENKELWEYQSILVDHFRYIQNQKYYKLLKNYLDQKMETDSFNKLFFELWEKDRKDFGTYEAMILSQHLSTFEANSGPKVDKFSFLIDDIFSWFENVGSELDHIKSKGKHKNKDYDIREKDYREELRKIFVQMQTILPK